MFSNQVFYEPETFQCAYPQIKETIPPSNLGYHSNNKYDGFPPLMSDGRTITASWQPEGVLNKHLLKELGIQSNWEYRQYLTKNAKDIMKYNCIQASTDSGYLKRYGELDQTATYSTPYMYKGINDKTQPNGYDSSDLKDLYISREQLQSRMVAPEITQDELLKMQSRKNQSTLK
jgi:hypothetical protein